MYFIFCNILTGDDSASSTTEEAELDKRIQELVDMEDPDILTDLRCHKESQFSVFWEYCERFLNEKCQLQLMIVVMDRLPTLLGLSLFGIFVIK